MNNLSPETLLEELGITEPHEIDLEAISFYCGAQVTYKTLDGCAARIIGVGDRAIISVNPDASIGRQRFSIGHELGHWMRDRGRATHLCQKNDLGAPWGRGDPESLANAYSADLLLPHFMFNPMAEGRDITLETVDVLRRAFNTSWTATAIRLVQFGSYPSVVACYGMEGRRWFYPKPEYAGSIWLKSELGHETQAFEVLFGGESQTNAVISNAGHWINGREAYRHTIYEHSMKVSDDSIITLLWLKDSSFFQ